MFAHDKGGKVRPPAVAGSFYPARPGELGAAVETLLAHAGPIHGARPTGIIAPHAGYVYSGPVAAKAFAPLQARRADFERVILIGPLHYLPVHGIAAPSSTAFATPLGHAPVDTEVISTLVKTGLVAIDDRAHAPEHALEVELPFLQILLEHFKLVPLLVGDATPQDVAAVIDLASNERTLLVVSTDLSHYLDATTAEARDHVTATTIERLDFSRLGPHDACGYAALNGALCAAGRKHWHIARRDLRNSGDTSGDRMRVVGYGAWVFSEAKPKA